MVSQHACRWYLSMPCMSGGYIPACLAGFQAHIGWGVSRPTPREEVEGSGLRGLQAHTQGGGWGVWLGGLQAHTWGGGVIPACTEADPPTADGYCCGRYASYWNTFLLVCPLTPPAMHNANHLIL